MLGSHSRVLALAGFFLCCGSIHSLALPPEKVPPKLKAVHSTDWYQAQATAWASLAEKEPRNTEAWLNWYTASRYALPTGISAFPDTQPNQALSEMVDRMTK